MPKYDFYANPPSTKADVREYITTWLDPIIDRTPVDIQGTLFQPISGFRHMDYIHTAYQNQATGAYVWYVALDSTTDYAGWPTKSYPTLDELLTDVIEGQCRQWGISA